MIKYSERIEETEVLGPGKRAVLWVFGCCFDCKGCIAKNFRTGDYSVASPKELADWYLTTSSDGLTISGGEPMLQAEALSEMIMEIKKERDTGIIVYTGFTYEELLKKPECKNFLNCIDLLIDGRYIEEENNNEPYRGSANQQIIPLTDRYKGRINSYYLSSKGRPIEIRADKEKTLMIGVPAKDQAVIWENIKKLGKK